MVETPPGVERRTVDLDRVLKAGHVSPDDETRRLAQRWERNGGSPSMRLDPPRRLTLSDLLVLVIAIAVGLAVPRTFGNFVTVRREIGVAYKVGPMTFSNRAVSTSDYIDRPTAAMFRPPIKGKIISGARQLLIWPGPCLAALSMVTLVLGLRASCRPLRRVTRRPGMAAGVAVAFAASLALVRCPQLLIEASGPGVKLYWPEWWLEVWFTLPRLAGLAVATSWLTLALSGRWGAVRGWPDGLGVALGACWIGVALTDLAATWYYALPV